MYYYLIINGKIISKPMTKNQAEQAIGKLRGTISGLEIMESDEKTAAIAKQKWSLSKRNIKRHDW